MGETTMHKHYMKVFRQAYIPDLFPKGLRLWSTKLSYNGNNQGSFGFHSVAEAAFAAQVGVYGAPGYVAGVVAAPAYTAGPGP